LETASRRAVSFPPTGGINDASSDELSGCEAEAGGGRGAGCGGQQGDANDDSYDDEDDRDNSIDPTPAVLVASAQQKDEGPSALHATNQCGARALSDEHFDCEAGGDCKGGGGDGEQLQRRNEEDGGSAEDQNVAKEETQLDSSGASSSSSSSPPRQVAGKG